MICIPITAGDAAAMADAMAAAAPLADLVELRMDYAPGADLEALVRGRPCPVIVTCRPAREGGHWTGSEEDRVAVLQRGIALGAEYVDVELDAVPRLRRGPNTKLIVSHHDFARTPEDLEAIHARLVASGADIAKIACMATDLRDNLRLFDLLRRTKHPTIALCMGELGLISRVLGRKFGSVLSFAALTASQTSAPGQLTAAALRTVYGYDRIGSDTAVYGVIANPVAHSMSPAILNAAFRECGMDAVYLPFKVEGDVGEFLRAFQTLDVRGYSVTIPHKQAALKAMDELDPRARRVGAVNTIAARGARFYGTNTDVPAALGALEEALGGEGGLRGRRALVIGAGGAGRALAFGLADAGASVIVCNRTHARAVELAAAAGGRACPMDEVAACSADVIVNTTSVGMHPASEDTPVPAAVFKTGQVVMDAVYNPPETRFLREARAAGCATVSGAAWFIRQAALQFEVWTGRKAPTDVMEHVLRERLG